MQPSSRKLFVQIGSSNSILLQTQHSNRTLDVIQLNSNRLLTNCLIYVAMKMTNNTNNIPFPRADGFHEREVVWFCSLRLTFPSLLRCWDLVRKCPGQVKNLVLCLLRLPARRLNLLQAV